MRLQKLQKLLFYFIIFLIPCNLGKHWPQDWSYVHGILVDYLIPTLYLTDILILILFLLWIYEFLKTKFKFKIKNFKIFNFILVIFLFTIYSLLFTKNPWAAIYKLIKLIEFGLFIFYIKSKVSIKKDINNIVPILSLSVIWQSVLAITQWLKQGSIFGYWFFGEQSYTSATLGIKKINFFNQIKVVPMGTFPHPNVLAGFLIISLLLILSSLVNKHLSSRIKIAALVLGIITLGLTFSFPAWIALLLGAGIIIIKRKKSLKRLGKLRIVGIISMIGILMIKGKFNDLGVSLERRIELNKIALKMWQSSPIFGIGLNNFIPRMEEFGRVVANYRFLQPVHNIFLLALTETGLIGLIGLISFIGIITKRLMKKRKKEKKKNYSLLIILYSLLFLGLFDHYWLTIQQGILGVSIIMGLTLAKPKTK